MTVPPPVDLEALLVALVLAPATFSRNRFFALYTDAAARRVRRRASMLRSIVRQISGGAGITRAEIAPAERGATLTYEVPSIGLKRTAALDALELSVLRFAVARAARTGLAGTPGGSATGSTGGEAAATALPEALRPDPADSPVIEAALARLLPSEPDDDGAGAPGAADEDPDGEPLRAPEGRAPHAP